MHENNAKKPPTDFTIDCILSKSESSSGDKQKSPSINHPMNKVLDSPWISKCPSALTYNPSSHRKLSFPSTALSTANSSSRTSFFNNPNGVPYIENKIKITQHFTSVHNHFYAATSTSSDNAIQSDESKLRPTFNVYDTNKSCDNESKHDNLNLGEKLVKHKNPCPVPPNSIFKCTICSKNFESSEILDVGLNLLVKLLKQKYLLQIFIRFTKSVI